MGKIVKTNKKQTTLASDVFLEGVGLHTGENAKIRILKGEANLGIVFKRVDLEGAPTVKAISSNVTSVNRSTSLKKGDAQIHTCEHLMAAFAGLGIDNAIVEVNASELPILDGSSRLFVDAIEKVGIVEQEQFREEFVITETLSIEDKDTGGEIVILPSDRYQISVMIDYGDNVINTQNASLDDISKFKDEISACRTFCLYSELQGLIDSGLIKGGRLNNAIIYVDKDVSEGYSEKLKEFFGVDSVSVQAPGILDNVSLRYRNEAARHKLLDMVGDLALIGMRIRGHVIAKKPGHSSNVKFAKKVRDIVVLEKGRSTFDNNLSKPIMDVVEIMKRLPHRPPFLLVDRIYELSETHVVGSKSVTMNEPFFVGHFPGEPVMPGVLQVEAMAQVGGILVLSRVPDPENYLTFFMKIDNVKFKNKVVPGDNLVFHLELITPIRRGICHMQGYAYVDGKLCSEAELMAQVVKVKG